MLSPLPVITGKASGKVQVLSRVTLHNVWLHCVIPIRKVSVQRPVAEHGHRQHCHHVLDEGRSLVVPLVLEGPMVPEESLDNVANRLEVGKIRQDLRLRPDPPENSSVPVVQRIEVIPFYSDVSAMTAVIPEGPCQVVLWNVQRTLDGTIIRDVLQQARPFILPDANVVRTEFISVLEVHFDEVILEKIPEPPGHVALAPPHGRPVIGLQRRPIVKRTRIA